MILVGLTYYSRNRLVGRFAAADEQLATILAVSVSNNCRDGITGGLIYDGDWFAQVLEGPESTLTATFERILRDPRHSEVALVSMQPILQRRFGAWWMAGAARKDDNAALFRHYGESDRFDPRMMRTDRLYDLIGAVVERAHGRTSWTTGSATNAA